MRKIIKEDVEAIETLSKELLFGKEIQEIKRLNGLTNHTYYVRLDAGEFVFRLPGEGTEELINRKEEYVSTELASNLEIDSRLFYFRPESGIKVTEYIKDAVTMSPDSMREEENIKLAANIFKKLHTCGKDTKIPFDVFDMAKGYEKIIKDHRVSLFEDYEETRAQVMEIRKLAYCPEQDRVPCHNDPLCENWVRSGDRMYLVDWEYAGMNDPMWDLADLALESGYVRAQEVLLLENYLGREISQCERERFRANKIYIDLLWSLWGKTRVPYDGESMEEYARQRYLRLKKNIENFYV